MRLSLLLFLLLGFSFSAQAESKGKLYQAHIRTGLLSANFSGAGAAEGNFSVPNTIDLEFEFFSSNKTSFLLRTMMAMELSSSQVKYTSGGVGQRFYFKSQGMQIMEFSDGSAFISVPKLRYYAGWDTSIAQVLVIEFGPVLGSYATILDMGGNTGVIYQMSDQFGLEAQLGLTYGLGFSSVSVSGLSYRFFLGGSYFF